jgi:uncharacterized protein with PIN domain
MKKLMMLLIAALTISSVSVFAQEKAGKKDTTQHTVLYKCPMHPTVTSDKMGKCTECGMDLIASGKEQMKKEVTKGYNCPVHLDVVSEKPGKCSKCGKSLLKSPKEQMKEEVVNKFSCSMHPEEKSDKAGKCSICGMDLTSVKDKKENHH